MRPGSEASAYPARNTHTTTCRTRHTRLWSSDLATWWWRLCVGAGTGRASAASATLDAPHPQHEHHVPHGGLSHSRHPGDPVRPPGVVAREGCHQVSVGVVAGPVKHRAGAGAEQRAPEVVLRTSPRPTGEAVRSVPAADEVPWRRLMATPQGEPRGPR